jgi:hypothetical protein
MDIVVGLEITHNYVHCFTPITLSILSTVGLEITYNYVHCFTPMTLSILSTVGLEMCVISKPTVDRIDNVIGVKQWT